MNTAAAIEELVALQAEIATYEDDPSEPYYNADGSPWVAKYGQLRGPPPERHPRRCHAESRFHRRRCGNWCTRGRNFCKWHGGLTKQGGATGKNAMPSLYSKLLQPALAARLEEFMGSGGKREQLELYEEIALARTLLCDNISLHRALVEKKADGNRITDEMILLASSSVQEGINNVADLCGRMASIEKSLSDKVSIEVLGSFVEDITRLLYRRLGDDSTIVTGIVEDLRTKLRLPGPAAGTQVVVVDLG